MRVMRTSILLTYIGVYFVYGDLDKISKEDKQTKTESLLRSLHHYEMTIPKLVTEEGHFVSYNIRGSLNTRRKRGASNSSEGIVSDISGYRIFYRFYVFGKEFHFDLQLNTEFMSPNFFVEYHGRDSVLDSTKYVSNCYYVGHSRDPFISTAAMSNCYGLHGVFSTDEEDYFVEPLWNHTNNVDHEGHPHVVYKRSALKLPTTQAHCGVQDKQSNIANKWLHRHWQLQTSPWLRREMLQESPREPIIFKLKPRKVYEIPNTGQQDIKDTPLVRDKIKVQKAPRKRREVVMSMPDRTVETLVVVDKEMYSYHKHGDILEPYVLTIMNIVAKLYRDPSIGHSINIVVSKLIVLTEDVDNLSINHHADKSLDSFCKWQHKLNNTQPHKHDNAVLMTRYDICTYKNKPCGTLGLAPVAGMCEGERSCSINEDIGLASAFTVAHEVGHNFGMQHDGAGNLCGTPGQEPARIMAARLTSKTNPFLWSNCSKQYMADFLESGRGSCLDEVIGVEHQADTPVSDHVMQQDANKQCRQQFYSRSESCKIKEICQELWCTSEDGQCVTNSIPASDGTPCRNYTHYFAGQCYRRSCVKMSYRPEPVDGQWSEWGTYSKCSRSCDGGVMSKERFCNNPEPAHGGRYCVGDRIKYKSCNTRIQCTNGSEDFRETQCAAYDNIPFRGRFFKWIPFTGVQSNPCALNCMADGFNFYTERASKVVDGTPCYPDRRDMCINGECRNVGCDGELGSAAREDKCRVCAGDGSSCHTISGMVDKSLPKGAYQEILKIPSGAMHIQVQEAHESVNYLALKSEDGPFYINGDWTIDWPRKFRIAGTVFHYERQNDAPEIMRAIGPTSENLVVMLLLQEDNQGVQYEYNVPHSPFADHLNVTQYTWTHSPWSQCSQSCGKGISKSNAVCVHKYRKVIVDDAYCFPQPKPSHHYKNCNESPCPSRWEVGDWSRCSQTCGGGRKTRTVVCKQRIDQNEEVILDDSECSGERPKSERVCRRTNCPAVWEAEEWTECSKRCGRGEMVRHVYCMTSDKEMYLDDTKCDKSRKPATIATCMKKACPQPEWKAREWTECTGSCTNSWQRRRVECRTHNDEPSDKCDPNKRPIDSRRCDQSCRDETTQQQGIVELVHSSVKGVVPSTDKDVEQNVFSTNKRSINSRRCDYPILDETIQKQECVDNYKFAYCPLVLKFAFCDRDYFLKMCCKTCQISQAMRGK